MSTTEWQMQFLAAIYPGDQTYCTISKFTLTVSVGLTIEVIKTGISRGEGDRGIEERHHTFNVTHFSFIFCFISRVFIGEHRLGARYAGPPVIVHADPRWRRDEWIHYYT